jgi:hypothetical protein
MKPVNPSFTPAATPVSLKRQQMLAGGIPQRVPGLVETPKNKALLAKALKSFSDPTRIG